MNNNTGIIREPRRETGLPAVRMVRQMITYRNEEITALSKKLRKGIIHLHREHSIKKHAEQAKDLTEIIDQISRLISDTDYDIYHLNFCHTQASKPMKYSIGDAKNVSSHDLHYIQ